MATKTIDQLPAVSSEADADELAVWQTGVQKKLTLSQLFSYLTSKFGSLAIKNTVATADIDALAVTYAKLQNVSATDKVLGRQATGAGVVEEIPCNAAGRTLLQGMSQITNSLGADVLLNNTANYFDGPSVAQGTVGTWFAIGTISLTGNSGDVIHAKLWDGTTVIASSFTAIPPGGGSPISLSGFIISPAANIRISAKSTSDTSGVIKFNQTSNSKDSTITAIRIA